MKIVFEGVTYSTKDLEGKLHRDFFSSNRNSAQSKIEHVGYYYDSEIGDAVMVLPKVFIYNNKKVFGKYYPNDILESSEETKKMLKKDGFDKILFELSTWVYQAIATFKKRNIDSTLGDTAYSDNIISNLGASDSTELDIILSLIRFHKENQHLFTYVAKLNHSGDKIHWGKTVSKKQPHLKNNTPIYFETVSKKKTLNFDEELIVIFYSTLEYFNAKRGFNITLNENYDLIKGGEYDRFIFKATKRLKAIKHKYFSDKFIALWKLLYAYYSRAEETKRSEKKREEVLLVKNFNIVFEDMIDDLIGDNKSSLPSDLKDQKDGKRVDHIYKDKSLIGDDKIYFIGDSKYYKTSSDMTAESVAKQFTYARNVIQSNINLHNKGKLPAGFRYRDDVTEGYNITPNFFISALVDEDFDFERDGLELDTKRRSEKQSHYADRLFDRDSLFVQRYDINFLFVLSAYISKSSLMKEVFKNKARKKFRNRMIAYFNQCYNFYEVTPKNMSVEEFVNKYFKELNGKIYRSSHMEDVARLIIVYEDDNEFLKQDFINNCEWNRYTLT